MQKNYKCYGLWEISIWHIPEIFYEIKGQILCLRKGKGILSEIYSMISEMSIFSHKAIDSGCTEVFLLPKVLGVLQVFMTWHRGKWAYMASFSCFHTADQMFVHDIILLSTPTCCYHHSPEGKQQNYDLVLLYQRYILRQWLLDYPTQKMYTQHWRWNGRGCPHVKSNPGKQHFPITFPQPIYL